MPLNALSGCFEPTRNNWLQHAFLVVLLYPYRNFLEQCQHSVQVTAPALCACYRITVYVPARRKIMIMKLCNTLRSQSARHQSDQSKCSTGHVTRPAHSPAGKLAAKHACQSKVTTWSSAKEKNPKGVASKRTLKSDCRGSHFHTGLGRSDLHRIHRTLLVPNYRQRRFALLLLQHSLSQ
jgi:hypothetical protein